MKETGHTVTLTGLSASYNKSPILRDINLTLNQGEFVCLCGPNGTGKSTLLSVIAGVPDRQLKLSGQVMADGQNITKLSRPELTTTIAYLQQNEYSEWDFTVSDYVLQGRYAHAIKVGKSSLKNFIKSLGPAPYTQADHAIVGEVLSDLSLTQFAGRTIHSLSGGEFQKVRLARAFAQRPLFLLLDEPAANLDYVYEPHLMQLLRDTAHSKNLGILAAVHDLNLAARFADKIILLPPAQISQKDLKKSVLSGSPSDIMNTDNLKYTFGVDFECREIKSFQSLL